jgi:hypothetical protein
MNPVTHRLPAQRVSRMRSSAETRDGRFIALGCVPRLALQLAGSDIMDFDDFEAAFPARHRDTDHVAFHLGDQCPCNR